MLFRHVPKPQSHRAPRTNTEIDLLLCCARTDPGPTVLQRAASLLEGPTDWDVVVRLARRHRIVPLLHLNLDRLQWMAVPADVRSELHAARQANAANCLQLAAELVRLLSVFEQAGIAAIPFKGVMLAARTYGDVALREAGDIDLLVRREDIARAVHLLESTGLRPAFPTSTPREARYLQNLYGTRRADYLLSHCEHHLVSDDGRLNVDLHWAIALREFSLPLDMRGLWDRATRQRLAGREMPALCNEDLLLALCVNGAKDCWERLDRVCDVAELIRAAPQLDWARLFDLSQRAGAQRMLRIGLSLARDLLDADLPSQVARFVAEDRRVASLAGEIRQRMFEITRSRSDLRSTRALIHLNMRERWRDRTKYCIAHLRPGVGDWAAVPLPRGLAFLYYLIRPFRLAGRYLLNRRATPPADRSSAS